MKIGVKITLLIVISVVGIAVVSILSINNLSKLNDMTTYMYERPVTNNNYAYSMLDRINNIARMSAMVCVDRDPAQTKRRMDAVTSDAAGLWDDLEVMSDNVVAPELQEAVANIRPVLETFKVHREAFQAAVERGDSVTFKELRRTEFQTVIDNIRNPLSVMVELTKKQLEAAAMVESEEVYSTSFNLVMVVSVVVALILIIIAVIIIMGITKPLKKAVEAAEKIASGDLNVNLETKSKDETGMLIRSMGNMVVSINAMGDDVEKLIHETLEGNLKYKADANKHQGTYKEIIKGTNELIEAFVEPINTTAKFLEDAAYGSDKLAAVTKEYKGDFNAIKNNINSLHKTLFLILGEMDTVGKASKVGDLSKRADTTKVQGAWVTIMTGLNDVVEASDAIINDAGKALGIMATGDLTPRITKSYPGKFGEMKDNINNLGDSLTDLISQLQEAIHTTASASAEISSTADTLAAATQEQSSQTDEVASAMEEMSRTVTDNAHSATRTADVARQSGEVANNGGKVVQQTVEKMREIAAVVKMSADNITKLGESSKKIGEIIGVIDDIADQTNLLSLNAAIEAARAGEQGRGFAVVADSVGKLAVSTATATKEIADMIKGIQVDTDAAVKAMEKGTSEVQNGIELADNAGHSLEDILSGINELLDMVNQIAAASEQQSATSEQISKNVSSISKVTADSARNVEDVATTANELARMTETLTSLVSQFKVSTGNNHSARALESAY